MKTEQMLKILIADDHPVYRDGMVAAIARQPDMRVVAECGDGDAAAAQIGLLGPDVALLDRQMPGLTTVAILERIVKEGITTRVLLISAHTDPDGVAEMLEAGAAGYLAKDTARDAICAAIRRVADGQTVIGYEVQQAVADHLQAQRERRRSLLSDREHEVLELLASGATTQEIADRLILGQATIKTHTRNLYEKLGVNDRAAAVAEAMRRGLIR